MDTTFDSNFFDNSSKCWRNNKIIKKNGHFVYRCCYIKSNNERCKLSIHNKYFCKKHMNKRFNEYTMSFV